MIKVYIGPDRDTKPFLIQPVMLRLLSDYFCRALMPGRFKEGNEGVLHFPEDDLDVWDRIMFWTFRRTLFPKRQSSEDETRESQALLVRCWAHGDKYGISGFQHRVMIDLLLLTRPHRFSLGTVKLGFERTAPGLKLRELLADEVALQLKKKKKPLESEGLDSLDGVVGFTSALVEALARHSDTREPRFKKGSKGGGRWKDLMVGRGPYPAWIYQT